MNLRFPGYFCFAALLCFSQDPESAKRFEAMEPQRANLLPKDATGKDAKSIFAGLELSQETTFDAITHALSRSKLTGESGKSLGTALDLIDHVTEIAGQKIGTRGDEQFRIYCVLKPDAKEKLGASTEFFRDKDNTVYHRDYPINFRQKGKMPSIQFSIERDGNRADIDVDYRSSRAPQGLFNGHLTAANSDIRAGANIRTHNRRYEGLFAWWQSLFRQAARPESGAPDVDIATPPDRAAAVKLSNPSDAVQEFLTDWFVRRKYQEALRSAATALEICANSDDDAENEVLTGKPALDLLLQTMKEASKAVGKKSDLGDAIAPLPPWDNQLRVIKHPYDSGFTLVEITEGEAGEFQCKAQTSASGRAPTVGQYGRFMQAMFQLRLKDGLGGGLILLWEKRGDTWILVSYDLVDG